MTFYSDRSMAPQCLNPSERSALVSEVLAIEKSYDDAWKAADIDGLLACLDADAVVVNPFGVTLRGSVEIREELARIVCGSARGSIHTSVISSVEFLTDDVSIVDGEAFVRMADEPMTSAARHHRFTDVLVRREGRWLIAHIRAYTPLRAASEASPQRAPAASDPFS